MFFLAVSRTKVVKGDQLERPDYHHPPRISGSRTRALWHLCRAWSHICLTYTLFPSLSCFKDFCLLAGKSRLKSTHAWKETLDWHAIQAGIKHSWTPGDFLMYMYSYWSPFPARRNVHLYVFVVSARQIPKTKATHVCLTLVDGPQKLSRMCMCTEFLKQLLKKKTHVFFPVGMVVSARTH